MQTINVNCVSSLLIGQALFENIKLSKRKQIIGMSSKMGSITDNTSGGRVAYRASKCALNSVFQEFSIEGKEFDIHSLLLHPGWVQTAMGGPNAPKTIEDSVSACMDVIDSYKSLKSGGFYDFDGKEIAW